MAHSTKKIQIAPTLESEAELVEQVVTDWCDVHRVDPKSHTAVMEGLRVLYFMREFDIKNRRQLLKALLDSDEGNIPEAPHGSKA
ncbi:MULTISPECIES: hypothetical protein [Sinorhizobium]|nr:MULTISPECIES: hypothetical protein [Sinorhizobium]PDT42897.1 hypothetical protein CO656_04410 [Sinorhizobium sp. FG01]PDT54800.1 hypothetical protein CO664_06790 [Sinorhizobium sp. NG07B]POH31843.1 hypothetical protein ATY30_10450 [Sinorhizobium americanum]POH32820.1 hypothetical protein ATY31_13055 [Sinorhizobium americanum]